MTVSKFPTQARRPLPDCRIEPVGDRCLLLRLGERAELDVSRTVHAVTDWLMRHAGWNTHADNSIAARHLLTGVIDVVPAFTTVAVHFRPTAFPRTKGSAFAQLSAQIRTLLADGVPALAQSERVVEIPACYGGEYGPDLDDVAHACGIDTGEVIRLHSGTPLVLYTFFFAPGNPFAGPLHPTLRVPRRKSPRMRVPAGSVAIANDISSIYQTESPGGWNLIARTPWNLFDVNNDPPTRLQLGDQIRFVPISAAEFHTLLEPRP
jgi:inhibitor of KinA